MTIDTIIYTVKRELISAFAMLDEWFDKDEGLMEFKPPSGWSMPQVLEHVMLTSHYLLILIDKGSVKALKRAGEMDAVYIPDNYTVQEPLMEMIGDRRAFLWKRPDHMEPSGGRPRDEIRRELRDQLDRCLCHLELLRNGEGILHQTTINVNDLRKLDVYQCIYFLAKHVKRHVGQLQEIEQHFDLELNI